MKIVTCHDIIRLLLNYKRNYGGIKKEGSSVSTLAIDFQLQDTCHIIIRIMFKSLVFDVFNDQVMIRGDKNERFYQLDYFFQMGTELKAVFKQFKVSKFTRQVLRAPCIFFLLENVLSHSQFADVANHKTTQTSTN